MTEQTGTPVTPDADTLAMAAIVDEVSHAIGKHGLANSPRNPDTSPALALAILTEELGEAAKAMIDHDLPGLDEPDALDAKACAMEVAQCGAVAHMFLAGLVERYGPEVLADVHAN